MKCTTQRKLARVEEGSVALAYSAAPKTSKSRERAHNVEDCVIVDASWTPSVCTRGVNPTICAAPASSAIEEEAAEKEVQGKEKKVTEEGAAPEFFDPLLHPPTTEDSSDWSTALLI
ncbi:Cysteine protease atg4c [Phytophthora pseudosyringae]|uniref:Cysteine protease atg4c n=1 Tax=Phytophthora pseudosyringae TaxID=221518 RepID=A0A8T1VL40_9STRA|nr:Cysteine protease atg4c [Phytophthora pseudosyringae]